MKVKVIYNRRKKTGNAPIHIEIYFDRDNRYYFHTGIIIDERSWNPKRRIVSQYNRNHVLYNSQIEQTVRKIEDFALQCFKDDIPMTPDLMKDYLEGRKDSPQLVIYARRMLTREGKNIAPETLRQRTSVINNLDSFFDGTIKDITDNWVIVYHEHLLKTMKPESTGKNHKFMKRLFKKAQQEKLIDFDPYNGFRIPEARKRTIFLTTEELNKVRNYQGVPRLVKIRDIFLFQCLTGVAYSDMQALTVNDLHQSGEVAYISAKRKKTDQQFLIPLLPEAIQIIEKYNDGVNLFPNISNQKMNAYLHEIETICQLNKPLTTHVARHTFATLMLGKGMPLESVSHILGHSSTRITQVYAKIVLEKLQEDFKRLNITKL